MRSVLRFARRRSLLCPMQMEQWVRAKRYVTGAELAEAGLAEIIPLKPLSILKWKC